MNEKEVRQKPKLGAMKKRRVLMADGKRYLIYYTFERDEAASENLNDDVKNDE